MDKQARKKLIAYCALFILLVAGLTVSLYPYLQKLTEPENQAAIQSWIHNRGAAGVIILFAVQVIQIVIAFIPGEPVELLAGVLYGTVGGLVICLAGCILASTIIFSLSKRFGKKLLYRLFKIEKVDSWKWLHDSKKSEMATFILFFIPGTPKDMLTYFVGITEMGVGKFLMISTLARIPSILSSTIIGATIRQGEWEISVLVFLITGIIGIVGIGFKERLMTFCREMVNRQRKGKTKCESLDFVEITHKNRVYPVMYIRMELTGHLDTVRLKTAIDRSCRYVPEILYAFGFKRDRFIEKGFAPDDVFFAGVWDLSQKPQLQISVNRQSERDTVIFGMSHILSDGEGFLQYLYLLAMLYNGEQPPDGLVNHRDIAPILKSIHVRPPTEQTRSHKKTVMQPLRSVGNGAQQFCLCSHIDSHDLASIHDKAKTYGVTLNDVFMAAYARVIARLQNVETVIIPCPADLRRFRPKPDSLTIANMTGIYHRITIKICANQTFAETVKQVNLETALQKSRFRCFAGISILDFAFRKIPKGILRKVVQSNYKLQPISYTNLGVIDHERLMFKGCHITDCYVTGTYRQPPDFQLSISTFRNQCTLNCTMLGTDDDKKIGQSILEQVKKELLGWIQHS